MEERRDRQMRVPTDLARRVEALAALNRRPLRTTLAMLLERALAEEEETDECRR